MADKPNEVRAAAREYKELYRDGIDNVVPAAQKLLEIIDDLISLPQLIAKAAGDVMADEGMADVCAQVLTSLAGTDSPVPDENFRHIRGTVFLLMSYTDSSTKFSKAVGSCGLVKHLVNILNSKPLQERLHEPMIRQFMTDVTGTLNNISRVPENRGCLRQAGVQDSLKFYSSLDDDVFKLHALMITAHVVDVLDCDPLGNSTDALNVLLNTLKKRSVYGRYKSLDIGIFLTEELMEALWLLTNCGSERRRIVEAGSVPILVQAVKDGRYAEKHHAVNTLHRLVQDPEIRPQLREMGLKYGAFNYEKERSSQTTQCGFKTFVKAVWGLFGACGSTQGKEVPSNDPGVRKWGPPEVAEWLQNNRLDQYARHFAEFDGKLFQKLLHIYELAPEMFQVVIREVAPLTCQDLMRLLRAVDRLLE
uniref:uncharacterized protein isoform X2 n=1 Tax=Myxine glutinosa TaxID=7769 RepID=UPI00358EB84E